MHPILFHLGRLTVATEGVLVAIGLLAGLLVSCSVGARQGIPADRIWNLGLTGLLTLFLAERMLVVAFNLQDFLAHPVWMLGLTTIRDERYFYGAAVIAICAGVGYISAWQLPWLRVLDALAPGAGIALACASLGAFAAGTSPERTVALYAATLHLALAVAVTWLALRARPGAAAACWLGCAGLATLLLEQLQHPRAAELLVLGAFTLQQAAGIIGFMAGTLCYFFSSGSRRPAASP